MNRRFRKKLLGRGMSGARFAEATEPDMLALRDLIHGALRKLLQLAGEDDPWPYVTALYADSVVVEYDGKLLRYSYAVDGQEVKFANPVEVQREFVPVTPAAAEPAQSTALVAALVEAAGDADTYKVRVIRAGVSANKNFYPDAVLRESVPLFNGARVFVKSDREHLSGGGKDVRALIGALSDAVFVEGSRPDTGEIIAKMTLIVGDGDPVAIRLREAVALGLNDLFGLSVDVSGTATQGPGGVKIAQTFQRVHSVDLIVEPGAGGQVISFLEAAPETPAGAKMDRDALIALIQSANAALLDGKDLATITLEELQAILAEALKAKAAPEPASETNLLEAVDARIRMREVVGKSKLPEQAKARLLDEFSGRDRFTEADVTGRIAAEAEYLAAAGGGNVGGNVSHDQFPFIESGETRPEKIGHMWDAFFDPTHKDHHHARSLKACYIEATGDTRVTGRAPRGQTRFTEADTSDFAATLGDGIHRRLLADYRAVPELAMYRRLTGEPVPLNDFRKRELARFGGYGDLPTVAESGPYTALATPTEEKAEYTPAKRGGTETVTLEMIKNDDVSVIRAIPRKMARAAARTLTKFVMDFIRTNPAIYDTKTLFHADHGNLGTSALSAVTYAAARLAMVSQKESGSNESLNIPPRTLWIPFALEETAYNIFPRGTNLDPTFVQTLRPDIVPVWYWTDANDWAVSADPLDIPMIELGFLDGQEEPEIFVQDNPNVGSFFSNDEITYKIRHIYGGAVADYRGLYKSVVA